MSVNDSVVDMVALIAQYRNHPIVLLEYAFSGLRQLSEQGDEESRIPQTRALVAELVCLGRFLEVAEELAVWLARTGREDLDYQLLEKVRKARSANP